MVDVLIIGGGLTGVALALALSEQKYTVLLVESNNFDHNDSSKINTDSRTIALAPASIKILKQLKLWNLFVNDANPIHSIHVSRSQTFGATRLHGKANDPLGYLIDIQLINQKLYSVLPQHQILSPAKLISLDFVSQSAVIQTQATEVKIQAQLIVAADGTNSNVRQLLNLPVKIKSYNQHALITKIELNRPHKNWAYERFIANGLLAMLPLKNEHAALIWCSQSQTATALQMLNEFEFLRKLQHTFGYRLGAFVGAGTRMLFPLQQVIMPTTAHWPCVFIGNAAHTLHPIAGQGFNLGLRDVATLAQCMVAYGLDQSMLNKYQTMRRHDQRAIALLTDHLIRAFGGSTPCLKLLRSLAFIAADNLECLQAIVARYARGYAGITSDLICGIDL